MLSDNDRQRIEQEAKLYAKNHSAAPDKDTPDWIVSDYMAGAKSERNKTIDEAIDIVTDYQDYNPLIIERLKAMKV